MLASFRLPPVEPSDEQTGICTFLMNSDSDPLTWRLVIATPHRGTSCACLRLAGQKTRPPRGIVVVDALVRGEKTKTSSGENRRCQSRDSMDYVAAEQTILRVEGNQVCSLTRQTSLIPESMTTR